MAYAGLSIARAISGMLLCGPGLDYVVRVTQSVDPADVIRIHSEPAVLSVQISQIWSPI